MSGGAQRDELTEFWSEFVHDPIKFVATFWPNFTLAPYQQEILRSVASGHTETWVHSANEMGKSFVAALTAVWWFASRPSKVVTVSTTEDQLRGVLWGEIGSLLDSATYNGKPFDFGFVVNDLEIRYRSEKDSPLPKYYIRGRVARKVESIQGNHLPLMHVPETGDEIGTVLFVVEEGSGVDDIFFPAFATQAHSTLVIGNPIRDQGIFAETCKAGPKKHPNIQGRLSKNVIHVSGEHSPNVRVGKAWKESGRTGRPPREWQIPGILSYDVFLEREANLSPYEKQTRLYGKFPEEAGQRMFPRAWLDIAQRLGAMLRSRAEERSRNGKLLYPGKPFGLGIDVAQGGGDLSVWVVWGRFGVVDVIAKDTPNTSEIAGTTLATMRRYNIHPAAVAFDSGGGGKQIADQLREKGYEEISDVPFGAAAMDPKKYKNRRAELYGELREAMTVDVDADGNPTGRIGRMLKVGPAKWGSKKAWCASLPPDDAMLRGELAVLPLLRDGEGRLRMLPKDKDTKRARHSSQSEKTIRELLGRSPDRGDACVLAYWAWQIGREYQQVAESDGDVAW